MDELYAAVRAAIVDRPVDEEDAAGQLRRKGIAALLKSVQSITKDTDRTVSHRYRGPIFGNRNDLGQFAAIFLEFDNAVNHNRLEFKNSCNNSLVASYRRMLASFQGHQEQGESTQLSLNTFKIHLLRIEIAHRETLMSVLRTFNENMATAISTLGHNFGFSASVHASGHIISAFSFTMIAWRR